MTPTDHGWEEVLAFLFITVLIFLLLGSTGKVHLGFYNPLALPPMRRHYRRILKKKFPFYHLLPSKSQSVFEKKLQYFIHQKHFVFRGGLSAVTDEMKVLIAASAIQITFGMPKAFLKYFKKVLIYPESYQHRGKGEVNLRDDMVVLPWKNFSERHQDQKGGINPGLYEMAYALKLESQIRNLDQSLISALDLERWDNHVSEELPRLKNSDLFRKYALNNKEEFFAACLELFFEKPIALHDHSPDLYNCFSRLLNQNPYHLISSRKKRVN